jgi:ribonuclease R
MFGGKVSKELVEMLKNSEKLREILAGYKQELGVLGFDFPETKIELDKDDNPIAFTQYTRHHSMKIIEEFMIVANEAVSKKYQDLPFLYRVHPQPDEDDSAKLVESLAKFGYHLPTGQKLKPKDIQKVLDEVK